MIFWSRSPSLQQKIITAIVMVGLLPLTLSLLITYLEERRALRETIGANFKETAVETASKIEMQVMRAVSEAQQLAVAPFLRTAALEANRSYAGKDEEAIKAMISDWQGRWRTRAHRNEFPLFINRLATNTLIRLHDIRKSDYLGILVTDTRGALVVSSIPQVEYYYGKTSWWQSAYNDGKGQVYVSDIHFEPSFGTHLMSVSVPILDEEHQTLIGAVTLLVRRDTLFRVIAEVTIGASGHAMLMSADGVPLICPILAPEEHVVTQELVSRLAPLRSGWAVVGDDSHGGQDAIVGFAPVRLAEKVSSDSLGGKPWIVMVRQDPAETYAPLSQLLIKVAAYGVVVFAVLWGSGLVVAGRLVRPIRALKEGVQHIGAGALDHRFNLKTGDEIEQLAHAFNAMAENLKRSFDQLEQRMAEIRRLEANYRDLVENSPEMIHQLNRAGQFVHVNKTELEKLGYSLDEMRAMRLWDIVPRGQEREILSYLERLVAEGRSSIETAFVTKNGQVIDVEIHATALFDSDTGGLVHSRAFVRDITQRKHLEQRVQRYTLHLEQEVAERTTQLSASERRYKALFDLAADSVLMVGAGGQVIAVNKREEQTLGYEERELVGREFVEIVGSRDRLITKQLISELASGMNQIPTKQIEVITKTGMTIVVEMDLIRVGDVPTASIMIQLRDITERKRLEHQLQQYREELEIKVKERTREIEKTKNYLENLLENANDVIYTLDSEQRFTYVNNKVEAWGYRKDELLGRPYLSVLSKRHRGRRLKSTLDIGAKQVYEVEVLTRNGQTRDVMVSVSPLHDPEGMILGVLGIARDITETKRMEQQIRNSERLASVGKLAAGVAHEINNPLGGILNCLYNIRKGTVPPERQAEYSASMEDGLRRVQRIVRQLLDFSQQHEPEPTPTDINVVIERVLVLTDHTFTANQIRLVRELDSHIPLLMIDRHMIEQVLMNLILNAVQATKAGGSVTIRTRLAEGHCVVDVEDTGCGIPTSVLPRIFDPFFTTKGTGEGTGLGLSVTLGIVERHGGHIQVESEVGKGTSFSVHLPLISVPALAERNT